MGQQGENGRKGIHIVRHYYVSVVFSNSTCGFGFKKTDQETGMKLCKQMNGKTGRF